MNFRVLTSLLLPTLLLIACDSNLLKAEAETGQDTDARGGETGPLNSGFANFIAVNVGKNADNESNYPLVTVEICAPGTQICQSIPNIFLDTGSTGLRLKTKAIQANLLAAIPIRKDSSQNEIAECYEYEDSDDWWGSIGIADIKLGNETAPGMSVELVDPTYKIVPTDCQGNVKKVSKEHINGVLGINFPEYDCYDQDCRGDGKNESHYGMAYYVCDKANHCFSYTMPRTLEVSNPIYALGTDSNGYQIQMPKVNPKGSVNSLGRLTFGINTRENNQVDASTANVALNNDNDTFPISINGNPLNGFLDSGTSAYVLPAKQLGIPICSHDDGSGYLCPTSPEEFTIGFRDEHSHSANFQIAISSAKPQNASGNFAFDHLAINAFDDYPNQLFLGMPFFFGRTIYFGFENSPLGSGKHVAILSSPSP